MNNMDEQSRIKAVEILMYEISEWNGIYICIDECEDITYPYIYNMDNELIKSSIRDKYGFDVAVNKKINVCYRKDGIEGVDYYTEIQVIIAYDKN